MDSTKPILIFVPGAWHGPEAFAPTTELLQDAGYEVVGCSLASVGADPPLENWGPDIAAIRKEVEAAVEKGRGVVVVAHSYGGLPAQEAVKGLDKKSRAKAGQQGGVVRLVFLAAFFAEEGGYLFKFINDQPLPWFDIQDDVVYPLTPEKIFYNDLPPAEASKWISKLKHHSINTLKQASKTTYAAWKDIPSTYVVCEADEAIPVEAQDGMLAGAGPGIFEVERCGAGHCLFLSRPVYTADVIRRAAGENVPRRGV